MHHQHCCRKMSGEILETTTIQSCMVIFYVDTLNKWEKTKTVQKYSKIKLMSFICWDRKINVISGFPGIGRIVWGFVQDFRRWAASSQVLSWICVDGSHREKFGPRFPRMGRILWNFVQDFQGWRSSCEVSSKISGDWAHLVSFFSKIAGDRAHLERFWPGFPGMGISMVRSNAYRDFNCTQWRT